MDDKTKDQAVRFAVDGFAKDLKHVRTTERLLGLELDSGSMMIGMFIAHCLAQGEDPITEMELAPDVWRRVVMGIRKLQL